ncbi:hypothetical protein IIA29_00655 [candidate division KSB1 bacterium]|nr:hypothetical protein [candidate division KSB1 bacterium]
MLTRVATKVSLFAAFITFVYCVVTDISMAVSFTRALVVFAGFYLILIAFFITLRLIFGRRKKEEDEQIGVPQDKEEAAEEKELAKAETVGVEGE